MSEVLYRKYRPKTFSEVVGQDHVVSTLETSIKKGQIAHAYLFSGSRGTGKTSIARIFAHAIDTKPSDIYEIDAASNRGIDDVRALREGVRTLPLESKHKVYIIDEVHMLTKEAFNALLKTLEEPPAHVIFILATTELEKVPDTIISRCQTYTFKKPTESILASHVQHIAKAEGYSIPDDVATLVALSGDGSFRDTLGALQKVIARADSKKIVLDVVESVLGTPSHALVRDFVAGIVHGDSSKALTVLHTLDKSGSDAMLFLKEVIMLMRFVLIAKFGGRDADKLLDGISTETKTFVSDAIKEKSPQITSKTLVVLLDALSMQRVAFVQTLPLELAVFEILSEKES